MKIGIKAEEIMNKNPILINESTSVIEAAQKMMGNDVSSLIVVDGKKLKGVVTEHDIVEKIIAKKLDSNKFKVKDIMTCIVHGTDPSTDIADIIKLMNDEHVRRVPVIKNGNLLGLVTYKDILKFRPNLIEKFIIRSKTN